MEKRALAHSRAYSLFSQLFEVGLKAETFAIFQDVPELRQAVPGEFLTAGGEFCEDAAAAAHFALFGLNIFPYESIFLAPEGILEGEVSQRVRTFYNKAGIDSLSSDESSDHIAQELRFLSSLCAAEANYFGNDLRSEVYQIRDLQRNFLENHLLKWLPVLAIALRQHEQLFYAELADFTVELALSHWEGLVGDTPASPPQVSLPSLPQLLEDERTGIKDIAEYLLTPAYSGFFLSRGEITKLAKQNQLMRGFGSRKQMLTNLLRAANEYEVFPSLLKDVEAILDGWKSEYQSMSAGEALLVYYIEPWLDRLKVTRSIFASLKKAALEIV